jgi:hypothetical protein
MEQNFETMCFTPEGYHEDRHPRQLEMRRSSRCQGTLLNTRLTSGICDMSSVTLEDTALARGLAATVSTTCCIVSDMSIKLRQDEETTYHREGFHLGDAFRPFVFLGRRRGIRLQVRAIIMDVCVNVAEVCFL